MALFIINFLDKNEGKEFVGGIKQRMQSPSYTMSWITSKVSQVDKYTVFEFTPEIPKFHYLLFILAVFMYLISIPVVYCSILVYFGLFVLMFWSTFPYILMMLIGYKKQFGHYPDIIFVSRKQFIKTIARL